MSKQEARRKVFNGENEVDDPNDPKNIEKLTDEQKLYVEPGGPWKLQDLNGRRFTNEDLRGSYYLLFFGNTLCPEATPFTILNMCKAIKRMNNNKEGQYIRCKGVFVTVRPDYDTK